MCRERRVRPSERPGTSWGRDGGGGGRHIPPQRFDLLLLRVDPLEQVFGERCVVVTAVIDSL